MNNTKRLFEYFSKSTFYIKISKFAVIILLLIFSVTCIITYRKDITAENIQLLAKFISLDGSSSHYSEEFSVTVKEDSDIIMLRDNLAIISNSNISLHDLSGRKLFSYNYSMSSPAVSYDPHYILVYDVGGTEATVFNSFSKIKTFKFDFPIYSADIRNDHVAFITGNDLSRSVLSIYEFDTREKDYILIYNKKFDRFLNGVSLTDNGKNVLVSAVSSKDARYDCSLSIFNTNSDSTSPLANYNTNNELPVKSYIGEHSAGSFTVTDSSVIFFEKNLKKSSIYQFNQSKASDFYNGNDILIITEKNNLAGNSIKATLLSYEGAEIRSFTVPDEVYDITIGKKYIYALGKNGVYRYAIDKENSTEDASLQIDAKYHSVVCDTDDNCYLVSYTLVSKVSF